MGFEPGPIADGGEQETRAEQGVGGEISPTMRSGERDREQTEHHRTQEPGDLRNPRPLEWESLARDEREAGDGDERSVDREVWLE
jgi:hypothetical protein